MLLIFGGGISQLYAACASSTILDGILKTNVDKDGYIDYDAIRVNKGGDLYEYISFLEDADLKGCTENERVAFWVNAYNAHAMRLILARSQMTSLSDDFKMFGEKFKVANHQLSLNDIEHRLLRASAKNGGPIEGLSLASFDPRLHFVLVPGALGGPAPRTRALMPASLEATLQGAAAAYVNSPRHVWIDADILYVSSLFRWYAQDFDKNGGPAAMIAALLDPKARPDAAAIAEKLKTDFPELTQFRFDWTVNSTKNKVAKPLGDQAAPK